MRIQPVLIALLLACPTIATAQHEHEHENGYGHSEPTFEYLEPYHSHARGEDAPHGHAGHTSLEGYPFMHGIRTEIDFIERALEFDLARANNADDGSVDELEFEAELVWALNDRLIVIVGAPLVALDPIVEPNTAGLGDMELGIQFLGFDGERDLLFFALNATVPTGDDDRDLGAGHTAIEPTVLWLHDFGRGTYTQTRLGWEIPVATPDLASQFNYDVGLYHTCLTTECWSAFRFLTPLIEFNGTTALTGAQYGETVVDLTTGLRWMVREMDEVGFGWSVPITGSQNFDHQWILSYRLHF